MILISLERYTGHDTQFYIMIKKVKKAPSVRSKSQVDLYTDESATVLLNKAISSFFKSDIKAAHESLTTLFSLINSSESPSFFVSLFLEILPIHSSTILLKFLKKTITKSLSNVECSSLLLCYINALLYIKTLTLEYSTATEKNTQITQACFDSLSSQTQTTFLNVKAYYFYVAYSKSKETYHALSSFKCFNAIDSSEYLKTPSMWEQFGKTALACFEATQDLSYVYKAHNFFTSARESLQTTSSVFYSAIAASLLFTETCDKDYYYISNTYFLNAAKKEPRNTDIFIEWGNLLIAAAYHLNQQHLAVEANSKFASASALLQDTAKAKYGRINAYIAAGKLSENLDYFLKAEAVISEMKKTDTSIQTHYLEGLCLFEFGTYFDEFNYFSMAIDAFQKCVSIDRTFDKAWYMLSKVNFQFFKEMPLITKYADRSHRFIDKALFFKKTGPYYLLKGNIILLEKEACETPQKVLPAVSYFEKAYKLSPGQFVNKIDIVERIAYALDLHGEIFESVDHYLSSLELFEKLLPFSKDQPYILTRIALIHTHLATITENKLHYEKALENYAIADSLCVENSALLIDYALTLMHYSEEVASKEQNVYLAKAHIKLSRAQSLGSKEVHYHFAALYTLENKDISIIMSELEEAKKSNTIPSQKDIVEDEWFSRIRDTKEFINFTSQLLM